MSAPTRVMSSGSLRSATRPSSRTSPLDGRRMLVARRMKVVLPAPLSPIKPTIRPAVSEAVTAESACTPSNDLLTSMKESGFTDSSVVLAPAPPRTRLRGAPDLWDATASCMVNLRGGSSAQQPSEPPAGAERPTNGVNGKIQGGRDAGRGTPGIEGGRHRPGQIAEPSGPAARGHLIRGQGRPAALRRRGSTRGPGRGSSGDIQLQHGTEQRHDQTGARDASQWLA